MFKVTIFPENPFFYVDDIKEAFNLIKDVEPTSPNEYILRGVVNAVLGQDQGSVSSASHYFIIYFTTKFCSFVTFFQQCEKYVIFLTLDAFF